MSFKDLEKVLEVSEPKFREDPYKFAFIRCLREINGNLDSIALFQKSHLELLGQIARELNQTCELQVKLLDLLARMIDQQIQALNRTNELTEKNFAQAASYVEELKPKHTGLDDGPPNSIKRASKK